MVKIAREMNMDVYTDEEEDCESAIFEILDELDALGIMGATKVQEQDIASMLRLREKIRNKNKNKNKNKNIKKKLKLTLTCLCI